MLDKNGKLCYDKTTAGLPAENKKGNLRYVYSISKR